jgi:hypothetical protein
MQLNLVNQWSQVAVIVGGYLLGMYFQNRGLAHLGRRIDDLRDSINNRFDDMNNSMNKRFDDVKETWRAELRRVEEVLDARLKHIEDR